MMADIAASLIATNDFFNNATCKFFTDKWCNLKKSQEIVTKMKDKLINHNIFRTQRNDSTMCGFFYIAFIA